MKFASIRSERKRNRHGDLVVVSRDNQWAVRPDAAVAATLLEALENWAEAAPRLQEISDRLNAGREPKAFRLNVADCLAPLPQAPGFYDGSAFLSHVVRARRARGDQMPESAKVTPLMYQGVSDNNLPATSPLDLQDPALGGDFEGELAVVTGDVPRGTKAADMAPYVRLLTLFNDVTLREIVKVEIETKFGFLQGKPNSSYAPFMVTPDELGDAWQNGRVHGELTVKFNGEVFGRPDGREMNFSFYELVAHACRTRPLSAGSIVGSGTISNEDPKRGFACLTEKRFVEIAEGGKPQTPWLKVGDRMHFDFQLNGASVFGAIDQVAVLGR
jgi:fumarylacetoacetate (FAA) hydrolase